MIDHLDNLLRHLFMMRVTSLRPKPEDPPLSPNNVLEEQVRFQPPDDVWRQHVSGLGIRNALNVYLVDLRENRKLRSNERVRTFDNGFFNETPAPRRLDCHYLITAWSPATPTEAVEPTPDEQALLYEVIAVLMNHEPLVARQVFEPDPLPSGFPQTIADVEIPVSILPVEGFPKYAEFWGTMGANHRWKPAVYLVVTLPVLFPTQEVGAMVTTRITEYRQRGRPDTAEVWIEIGGRVLDATVDPPFPLAGAWVQLETTGGEALQTTKTNALGRYSFGRLLPGLYQLRWRAGAHPEPVPRSIGVPSPTGEYDLRFE
jgi:hypothetical protein